VVLPVYQTVVVVGEQHLDQILALLFPESQQVVTVDLEY
jgi:hypothetical protein